MTHWHDRSVIENLLVKKICKIGLKWLWKFAKGYSKMTASGPKQWHLGSIEVDEGTGFGDQVGDSAKGNQSFERAKCRNRLGD